MLPIYRVSHIEMLGLYLLLWMLPAGSLAQSTWTADSLCALDLSAQSVQLQEQGQFRQAFERASECQDIYTRWKKSEKQVATYIEMAKICDEIDYQLKAAMADSALYLAQEQLDTQGVLMAGALRQKGEVQLAFGRYDSAVVYLAPAMTIFRQQQAWNDLAWSEILYAVAELYRGRTQACEDHLDQVKVLLPNPSLEPSVGATLFGIYGGLYDALGDYEKAIDITFESLHFFRHKTPKVASDSVQIANCLNNLGSWYDQKGDHQRALDFLQSALDILKQLDNSKEEIIIASNSIGIILAKQEQFREAIRYFKQTEQLLSNFTQFENYQWHLSSCLMETGAAFRELNQDGNAFDYTRRALAVAPEEKKYFSLANLALLYIRNEQSDTAIVLLQQALENYQTDQTPSKTFKARIFHYLGKAYQQQQNFQAALAHYQQSLTANCKYFKNNSDFRKNPNEFIVYNQRVYLESLHSKAQTWAQFTTAENHLSAALSTYELLIRNLDSLRVQLATQSSWLHWSKKFKPIYAEAIHISHLLYLQSCESIYLEKALDFSEKGKASLLLASLRQSEDKRFAGLPDSLLQLEQQLQTDLAFYKKLLWRVAGDSAQQILYRNYASQKRLRLARLKEKMEIEFPNYFRWRYEEQAFSIKNIRKKISNEENAIISYYTSKSHVFAFVLTQESLNLISLGSPRLIRKNIDDFRQVLTDTYSFQRDMQAACDSYAEKAHDLYDLLLAPVMPHVESHIKKLVLSPDGSLHALPFEALVGSCPTDTDVSFSELPYVLHRFQVQYTFSIGLLLYAQEKRQRAHFNSHCLAVAPLYKANGTGQPSAEVIRAGSGPLIGNRKEVETIARYFYGCYEFGANATEHRFKEKASDYGLIHLAMHGMADFQQPENGYLEFSQGEMEDSKLYQDEVSNLRLQAQLVVLSACETGRGVYTEGEGVFSLARSFMFAGATSVVMSLWKVNDRSTSELMPLFYEKLAKGRSKGASLHLAKIEFLKNTDLKFQHPFYWSGFVLLGDFDTIKLTSNNHLLYLVLLAMALLTMLYWKWYKSR
ncbi:MAG: CHAT domain-containing tetratricopeptide repeat protein [Bacteroidota bacterium]